MQIYHIVAQLLSFIDFPNSKMQKRTQNTKFQRPISGNRDITS